MGIANNGDLQGGHLDHTGPVYGPGVTGWGDIIPPYTYVDGNGVTRTFPGYNWTDDGQAIWNNGCSPAPPPNVKLLTVAARVCPSYQDVTANLARNDIQESLEDLGPNTPYTSGQPIDPSIEAANQPNCEPLSNWTFTLGTGYKSQAVTGSWGSLSIVTGAYSTSIVTKDATPLLNDQGQSTGDEIDGAITVQLTKGQADLASNSSSLWIQGGTPDDPVLNRTYPGRYGFAALRCAVDNLNGDNVEWIGYPSGASHEFCFAYYVSPPPSSGTIVIEKKISSPAGATQTFSFGGNVSYNPGGTFQLAVQNGAPASETFFRAETESGQAPWSVNEMVPPGWFLADLTCASQSGKSTTNIAKATATITLAAGDTVTCTYSDSQTPPTGGLSLSKTTIGGTGTFGYTVSSSSGGSVATATATTTKPGVEVAATPATLQLAPGSYKIAESMPKVDGGTWTLTAVSCDGKSLPASSPVTVTITSGTGAACSFENTFVPAGAITIRKKTIGDTGTAGFTIFPQTKPASDVIYSQKAKVTRQGVPVLATGDDTTHIPLGSYKIQEFAATGTNPTGWALTSVTCNGKLIGSGQGAATVTLTTKTPKADCTFTNTYTPPTGNLTLDKTTLGGTGTFGYTITPSGGGTASTAAATTTTAGVEVEATPGTIQLAPGSYKIDETAPAGVGGTWELTAASCGGKNLPATTPVTVTITVSTTTVCSFENTFVPAGAITLRKKAVGNTGTVGFTITPQSKSASGPVETQKAKVTKQGVAVLATGDDTSHIPLGTYEIQEYATGGTSSSHWHLTSVFCNDKSVGSKNGNTIDVTLTTNSPTADCTFTNTYATNPPTPPPHPIPPPPPLPPTGAITLRKETVGNTGTVGFTITPETTGAPNVTYSQTVNVTKTGVPVRATGDDTSHLALGTYEIKEYAAGDSTGSHWHLTKVVCNGQSIGSKNGNTIEVRLTSGSLKEDCTFTNTYATTPPTPPLPPAPPTPPTPGPTPTPTPTPTPQPAPNPDPIPTTSLEMTKTADRKVVEVGGTVNYTIKITNTGHAPAQNVNVAEETPVLDDKVLSIIPSQGTCTYAHKPASCSLGTINPGQTVTILATVEATKPGLLPNNVAANSGTQVPDPPTAHTLSVIVHRRHPTPTPAPPKPTPAKPSKPATTTPSPRHKSKPTSTAPPFTG
ncbi:MAG TPA: DUF11 domain-containing protein [Gaiellaceae bacterium]|nr:DUF11 domain-containing protein [Gaiellaceae bacterium]